MNGSQYLYIHKCNDQKRSYFTKRLFDKSIIKDSFKFNSS